MLDIIHRYLQERFIHRHGEGVQAVVLRSARRCWSPRRKEVLRAVPSVIPTPTAQRYCDRSFPAYYCAPSRSPTRPILGLIPWQPGQSLSEATSLKSKHGTMEKFSAFRVSNSPTPHSNLRFTPSRVCRIRELAYMYVQNEIRMQSEEGSKEPIVTAFPHAGFHLW